MPHDTDGTRLEVGDRVTIEARVTQVMTGEDFCNVTLETDVPMQPSGTPYSICLNAKQVRKRA